MYDMEKHKPADEMLEDLDNLLSKINAMEILAKDEFQKGTVQILRMLVQGQMHSVREFTHMKKASDMLLKQIFDVQNMVKS